MQLYSCCCRCCRNVVHTSRWFLVTRLPLDNAKLPKTNLRELSYLLTTTPTLIAKPRHNSSLHTRPLALMMTTLQSKEDAFAVPDSTDWLSTPLTSLSAVEASMRCQVCKDFYQTPMITSCAHTFCSVCIRRCLSTEGKCPACRSSDQELKLRFNAAMEEAVQAFVRGREAILDYARTEKQVVEVEKGGRKRRERDVDGASEDTPRKRTRASTRSQSQTQSQSSQAPRERAVIEDSEDDGDSLLAGLSLLTNSILSTLTDL